MSETTLVLDLGGARPRTGWRMPFAGAWLWSDHPVAGGSSPAPRPRLPPRPDPGPLTEVYDGPGLVEGRMQRIRSWTGDGGWRVEYENGESYSIGPQGSRVERRAAEGSERVGAAVVERALGAPTALALAARGLYLLHASALLGDAGVVALCGETGAGKSTLAAEAAARPELGLRRVADDQVPVSLVGAPAALLHFPQLKLAPEAQYGAGEPRSRTLAAVLEVRRSPDVDGGAPRLELFHGAEACLALCRATVAARLFDSRLLAQHVAACAEASQRFVVGRLVVPNGLDRARDAVALVGVEIERRRRG